MRVTRRAAVLSVLVVALSASSAFAYPSGDQSATGAVYDSLCAGNASDPLVIEVVLRDAFDSPSVNYPASGIVVRRADGPGPSISADHATDIHGYTTITTTVGAVLAGGGCDSLQVVVAPYLVKTVRRTSAPLAVVPDCGASAISIHHGDVCPRFASDAVVVNVTLWSPLDLPIAGFPADSVTVSCVGGGSGNALVADAPTDVSGNTTITVTVAQLIDTVCCDTLAVRLHQGLSSCERHFLVSFGPYDGPYPNAQVLNPQPHVSDRFGYRAAPFQGDFLVGAPMDDTGHGSVSRVSAQTGSVLYRIPAPFVENRRFGSAIADAGGRILVGDPEAYGNLVGRAYLYDAQGALLFEIPNPQPTNNDYFGNALAYVAGTIFVAAAGDSVGGLRNVGTVYAFDGQTGAYRFAISNPHPDTDDSFGQSLGVRGNDLIVGASGDNAHDGSVYVFAADGTQRLHVNGPVGLGLGLGARVRAFGNDIVAATGGTVIYELDGNSGSVIRTIPMNDFLWTGDVVTTSRYIIFGLPMENNVLAPDAGYVYVVDGFTGALVSRIRDPIPTWSDWFGNGIAATETSLLIGAPGRNSETGTVFLYANGSTAAPVIVPLVTRSIEASPNPFRATTAISFSLPREERVTLSIHDVTGRLVRRLSEAQLGAGSHVVDWDGRDSSGRMVAAGVYWMRLRGGAEVQTGRVVRMR